MSDHSEKSVQSSHDDVYNLSTNSSNSPVEEERHEEPKEDVIDFKTATHGYDGRRRITFCGFDIPIMTRTYFAFNFSQIHFIMVSYGIYKGILYSYLGLAPQPIYIDLYPQPAAKFNRYITVSLMGFACKAGMGVIVTKVILNRRNRNTWASIATAGTILFVGLGFALTLLNAKIGNNIGGVLVAFDFFILSAFIALLDIITEGLWASMIPGKEEFGTDLISWAWGSASIGMLVGAAYIGPMSDHNLSKWIPAIALPFTFALIWPLIANWMMDRAIGRKERERETKKGAADYEAKLEEQSAASEVSRTTLGNIKITRNPVAEAIQRMMTVIAPMFYLKLMDYRYAGIRNALERFAVIMSIFVLTQTIVSLLYSDNLFNMIFALAMGIPIQILGFYSIAPIIAASNLYMFLKISTYITIGGIINQFWLSKDLPNGPELNGVLYYTVAQGIIQNVATFIGSISFTLIFSKQTWRMTYIVTSTLRLVASGIDILVVSRKNLDIHLSDKLLYLLGDSVLYQSVYMIDFMPAVALTSRLCPKHLEILMYATLSGAANAGSAIAGNLGSYLIDVFDIVISDPTGVFKNVDKLTWLVAVTHCFVPLIMYPLTFLLIPAGRINERKVKEKDGEVKDYSDKEKDVSDKEHDVSDKEKNRDHSEGREDSISQHSK